MHIRKPGSRRISGALQGIAAAAVAMASFATPAAARDPVKWTRNSTPSTVAITGGPWTLEQSGAANGLKSSGYCASSDGVSGIEINNPGTERMQPYYFPFIVGYGSNLQGYFDWRLKDTNEAVATGCFSQAEAASMAIQTRSILSATPNLPT